MQRLRALIRLSALVLFEAGAFLGLRAAGSIERWQVDWQHLWRWMGAAPPTDVVIGLLRIAGLVLVGYLAVTTAVLVLAAMLRLRRLGRVVGTVTLPGIRRTVERSLAVGMAASVLLSRAPAFAQEPASGWVQAGPAATATIDAHQAGFVPPAVEPSATTPGVWPTAEEDNYWAIAAATLARVRGVPVDDLSDDDIRPYWVAVIDQSRAGNRSGNPDLIFPGEVQTLPPVASGAVAARVPPMAAPAPAPSPAPEPPVAVPAPAAPAAESPAVAVVEPAPVVTAPSVTAVTAPSVTAAPTVEEEAPAVAPAVTPTTGQVEDSAAAIHNPTPAATKPTGIGSTKVMGFGIFCAGIAIEVARRRRRASRVRLPGEEQPEAAPEVEDMELETRVGADVDGVRYVDAAFRALAGVVDVDEDPPAPIGFTLSESEVTIVFEEAAVAPAPFRGRGTHWSLSRSVPLETLEELGADVTMPSPALVTLGRTAEGAEVVVEVESSGLVNLVGPGARDMVVAAGIQLATSPWSQTVDVILVGFDSPVGASTRAVGSLAEVIDEVEEKGRRTAQILRGEVDEAEAEGEVDEAEAEGEVDEAEAEAEAVGPVCESTFEARLRGVAEAAWVPTVLVCADPLTPGEARRLLGIVASGQAAGVAAVVNGPVHDSPWELTIERDGIAVDGIGATVVSTQGIGPREAVALRDMLEAAAHAPVPAPPRDLVEVEAAEQVVVHLYGPITIDGFPRPQKNKSTEAFAYLASHRGGHIDGDRLRGVLWPEGCAPRTLNDTMYYLRQVAGAHVPELLGSTRLYKVGDAVVTSVQLLERALAQGSVAELRAALALVRGRPFDAPTRAGHGGGRSQTAWEWAFGENHVRHAERVAGDAAHRLCDLALEAGDTDTAAWAIAQGLMADGENEQLRRDEMRVAAARRDRAALDDALAATQEVAAEEDEAIDPATVALYERLVAEVDEEVLVG